MTHAVARVAPTLVEQFDPSGPSVADDLGRKVIGILGAGRTAAGRGRRRRLAQVLRHASSSLRACEVAMTTPAVDERAQAAVAAVLNLIRQLSETAAEGQPV